MRFVIWILVLTSVLSSAAIFGFFYAWVCSTMWGLDRADPRTAIAAMQAMNASVRNAVFAPAFFATPALLALTAGVLWAQRHRISAALFGLGGAIYLGFGLSLTIAIHIPMNEALAATVVPDDIETARRIWAEYSRPWQVWNQVRTVASGAALLAALGGVLSLSQGADARPTGQATVC